MTMMMIDCAHCLAPAGSCDDCVVQVMLGLSGPPVLNQDEQAALAVLAGQHLVPPLRLVTTDDTEVATDNTWAGAGDTPAAADNIRILRAA